MPMPGGGYSVDPGLLSVVGGEIVRLADDVQATAAELSGESTALSGSNAGFTCQQALAGCEREWERAFDGVAARLALAGDLLVDNAGRYAGAEDVAQHTLAVDWVR